MRVLNLDDGLTVTKVGTRTNVGKDGGYWVEGDAGWYFWISPGGDGWYRDLGVFDQFLFGHKITSTVSYEVTDAFGETQKASISVVTVGTYVSPEAQDDMILLSASDAAGDFFDVLANDAGDSLSVVQVGTRTKAGKDGGFWVKGDTGGHFWISEDGKAWFWDQGDLTILPSAKRLSVR